MTGLGLSLCSLRETDPQGKPVDGPRVQPGAGRGLLPTVAPPLPTLHPRPAAPQGRSAALAVPVSSNGRRGSSGSGLGMLMRPPWPSAGAGVRVGIPPGLAVLQVPVPRAASQPPARARSVFPSAGV